MDVVVIGAGVVGASVACRLAQAGCQVAVLEASRTGAGTSGASFAWLNSNKKTPRSYHEINVAGMNGHRALRDELGAAPWLHEGGSLEIVSTDADRAVLLPKVERLNSWDYRSELLTPAQLRELEPDLDQSALGDATIAYWPDDGWLDPVLYAHAMMQAAIRHGAVLHRAARVADITLQGGRAVGVTTADGRAFAADRVVNCAGRWGNDASRNPDLHLPLAPRVGFLAFTPPAPVSLGRVLRTTIVDMRPDGAGRLMLHDNDLDKTIDADRTPSADMKEAHALVRQAAHLYPALEGMKPEAARITVRPVPADGYSAIGPMPGADGYYVVITHSGVTLSPFLGKAVAQEVAQGIPEPALDRFRPKRFFGDNLGPIGAAEALTLAG